VSTIKIKAVKTADIEQIIALYKDAGWWEESFGDGEFIPLTIRNSTVYVAAFEGTHIVGMGRAISDKVSDAYIQDVVVLSSHRKKGIGKMIMLEIIKRLKKRGIDWIGLISTPGSEDFYRTIGFEVMPAHSPMLLMPAE